MKKLLIAVLLLTACSPAGVSKIWYQDDKAICYKDYASGSISCVNK